MLLEAGSFLRNWLSLHAVSDVSALSVSTEILAIQLSIASLRGSSSSSPLLSSTCMGSFGAPVFHLLVPTVDSLPLFLEAGDGSGMFSGSLHVGFRPQFDEPNLDR